MTPKGESMSSKGFTVFECVVLVLIVLALIGEGMSIAKCIGSDWKAPYKREIIYGGAALTGLGSIVGYINLILLNVI